MTVFESSSNDVLGIWSSAPVAAIESFGLGVESDQIDAVTYRVRLSSGSPDSMVEFENTNKTLNIIGDVLDNVPSRLVDLVDRMLEKRSLQASGISFDVQAETMLPQAEIELIEMLSVLPGSQDSEASFGMSEMVSDAWGVARAQFNDLAAQIDRDLLHFAWVETIYKDELLARTIINWGGDLQTALKSDGTSAQVPLHARAILSVVQTRHLRLRLFVTIASCSVKVASLLAVPGSVVLALPAVFQYVTKIVAQARDLNSIQVS